jgi:predicted phage baseplate assembly protein
VERLPTLAAGAQSEQPKDDGPQREIRAQQRAVTAEDYEGLAKFASRSVARVKCRPPSQEATLPPGTLELLIVPAAFDALRARDLRKLYLDPDLIRVIEKHLDQYRLLTTSLRIREPRYIGIKVTAEIVVSEYSRPDVVSARVIDGLQALISPLAIGVGGEQASDVMGPDWEGWPFGRPLFVSEIYSLVQKIPGVKHVLDVRLSRRPVVPAREPAPRELPDGIEPADQETPPGQAALAVVDQKRVDIPADTLLCSLDHEIKIVQL